MTGRRRLTAAFWLRPHWMIAGAVALGFAIPSAARASVTFYTSRTTFNAAFPGLPNETFEDPHFTSGMYYAFAGPLSSTSPPPPAGPYHPTILPGPTYSGTGQTPALAADNAHFGGDPASTILLDQNAQATDLLVIDFSPAVTAVGLDEFIIGGSTANITFSVFNGATLLGSSTLTGVGSGGAFEGVSSSGAITEIKVQGLSGGNGAIEAIDNVEFGGAVPEPSTLGLAVVGLLTLLAGRPWSGGRGVLGLWLRR